MYINRNKALEQDEIGSVRLNLLCSGLVSGGAEWRGRRHLTHYARLYFILDSDGYAKTEKGEIRFLKDHYYLIPSGINLEFGCETKMDQLFFHLTLTNKYEYDLFRSFEEILEAKTDGKTLENLLSLYKKKDTLSLLKLRSDLEEIVFSLLMEKGVNLEAPTYSEGVLRAINYINENLSHEIRVSDISDGLFISESTLQKSFKREVGLSIGQFVNEKVMQRAEALLTGSNLSIMEISQRFGFCDQFYFSRCFKNRFGKAPKAYREQMNK